MEESGKKPIAEVTFLRIATTIAIYAILPAVAVAVYLYSTSTGISWSFFGILITLLLFVSVANLYDAFAHGEINMWGFRANIRETPHGFWILVLLWCVYLLFFVSFLFLALLAIRATG